MSNNFCSFILHAAHFYLSLSMWGLLILSRRVLCCQLYLHYELKLILSDLKYTKWLAQRSWVCLDFFFLSQSVSVIELISAEHTVSLPQSFSSESSLTCFYLQQFSIPLMSLTAVDLSCLLVMLLSSKPRPLSPLFLRHFFIFFAYCYRLPSSTCI